MNFDICKFIMSIRLVLSSLALYVNWIGFKFREFIILIRSIFEFRNILKITKSYIYKVI